MSHFSVLVITPNKPVNGELEKIMQPWHEYECTGVEDEYVIDVDITDEVEEKFNDSQKIVVLKDGTVLSRWDEILYTKEPKKFELPKGATEKEMTADEARQHNIGYATMKECAEDYFSATEKDGRFFNKTNPAKKWDWWQVGGRWTGMLMPNYDPKTDPDNKEKCWLCAGTGKRRDAVCENGCNGCQGTGIMTKWPTHWRNLDANQMQLKDVPVADLRAIARNKAAETYDRIYAIIGDRKLPVWDEIRERHNENHKAARDEYNNNEVIKALVKLNEWGSFDHYACDRDTFLRRAEASALSSFAVVKDGKWYERGEMGWWGTVSDEKDQDTWNREIANLLNDLPQDSWLTVVDCHI